jgi:MFS family permease
MWSLPALLFLIAFFHRAAPGVIAHELMEAFGVTGAMLGLLSATYFYSYAGFMVPAGLLIDAFGPRVVMTGGGVIMGAGTMAMGVASGTPLLFAGRFAVGLGATVTFIGALKIAAAWFPPERFGVIAAITATVGVLGALVATAPLAALVARAGWRGAFWVVGGVTLLCSALCLAIVRDAPGAGAPGPQPSLRAVLHGMRRVLANAHTWPPFLAFFCLYGPCPTCATSTACRPRARPAWPPPPRLRSSSLRR